MRRAARLGRAGLAVGLSAALVTTLAMPAAAEPEYPSKNEVEKAKGEAEDSADKAAAMKRKLAAEQTKLDQLDQEVEIAVEAYNGAVYRLGQAKQAYKSAKKRAEKSQDAVEEARSDVAAIASSAYAGRGVSQYVTLFGSDDPAAVANGAGALHALSQQQSGTFDRYRAATIVRDLVQKQSARALKKQRKETKKVAAAKRSAEAKLASQQQTLERVATLSAKLAKRAAADERAASNAAAERKAGIAEARRIAAEKAAAEARKRARAAAAAQEAKEEREEKKDNDAGPKGNGGGGGGDPDPGGGGGGGKVAVQFAKRQLGEWYLWAADGPNRWDCSGLTMRAWQQAGKSLPHWSVGQYYQTQRVSMSNLRKGDLVFFADNTSDPDTIHHVGIYVGGGQMIEAPHSGAQVRYASIYRSGYIGAGRP